MSLSANTDLSIVHLTDLHITEPNGVDEPLREGYYREYIEGFCAEVQKDLKKVDALIATGDFIDKNRFDNFAHAFNVLTFLGNKLDLKPDQIIMCPGNHDLDREAEKIGDASLARKYFQDFSNQFGNSTSLKVTDWASICSVSERLAVLVLDSTLNALVENHQLDNSEIDKVFVELRKIASKNKVLVVASHHPPLTFPTSIGPFEEGPNRWNPKRIWHSGNPLAQRLMKFNGYHSNFWLSGDHHVPDTCQINNLSLSVTGRFGTPISIAEGQMPRQAKIITLRDNGYQPYSFMYESIGRTLSPHYGRWRKEIGSIQNFSHIHDPISTKVEPNATTATIKNVQASLIDLDLQRETIRHVKEGRLFKLGRYTTNSAQVSLGWVAIGPLMNNYGYLGSVVRKMASWLNDQVSVAPGARPILIGLDCWGAVLASQLSVVTGYKNIPIAVRADGRHHSAYEVLDINLIKRIQSHAIRVIITDVVSTGKSMKYVRDQVSGQEEGGSSTWYALSLFSDKKRSVREEATFIKSHATTCEDLRIPILSQEDLPSEEILPADISFV